MTADTYAQLIELLDKNNATYRLIDHAPEGRTEIVSPMRGNQLSDAAKCMIVMVKIGKKDKEYVLCVIPGDAKVDMNAVKDLFKGTYVSFASSEAAEKYAGSVSGTILPFSFHPKLHLIADPKIKESAELFFNAARLDQSMALKTSDYLRIANPRFERITERTDANQTISAAKMY
jgi:Ala-tRNA(Pro) deacylase